ncbi:MAG: helix-turn-helix transcriptional regulator [Bilophila sp.]
MNATPSDSDSNAILDRLLSGAGLHRDAQLASLLGVSPQAVSQARRKRKIPEGWVVRVAQQCNLSMDWLMFGKEEAGPPSTPAPQAPSTPAGAPLPDLDLLCIPLVAASLSAGSGSLQTEGEVLDYFAFRSKWLCRKGNPDRMVLMKVYGDSMEPEIRHGDMALIDQSKQQIYPHTIYAVGVNEEIYIKQIETRPGHRLVLRSLNERYEPIEVDLRGDMAESVRIIGKVIWWCREA